MGTSQSPRPPSPEPDTAAMSPGEGDWRERAEAAEGKLAEIGTYCRERPELAGAGFPQMAGDILAIIGGEEKRVTESWEKCRG